ncbi:unnamed protein product, partial [Amoebophrya sp. A25]|eukprot:GSA25T00024888001.1
MCLISNEIRGKRYYGWTGCQRLFAVFEVEDHEALASMWDNTTPEMGFRPLLLDIFYPRLLGDPTVPEELYDTGMRSRRLQRTLFYEFVRKLAFKAVANKDGYKRNDEWKETLVSKLGENSLPAKRDPNDKLTGGYFGPRMQKAVLPYLDQNPAGMADVLGDIVLRDVDPHGVVASEGEEEHFRADAPPTGGAPAAAAAAAADEHAVRGRTCQCCAKLKKWCQRPPSQSSPSRPPTPTPISVRSALKSLAPLMRAHVFHPGPSVAEPKVHGVIARLVPSRSLGVGAPEEDLSNAAGRIPVPDGLKTLAVFPEDIAKLQVPSPESDGRAATFQEKLESWLEANGVLDDVNSKTILVHGETLYEKKLEADLRGQQAHETKRVVARFL